MPARPLQRDQLTPAASAHLDMLRGAAAIAVMLSHWRNFLFLDWPQLAHHNAALALLYFVTGFGHQAVIVFFVLSGYLIGGSVLRGLRAQRWHWKRYAVDRVVRLGIVLLPALLLCLALDAVGIRIFHGDWLYSGSAGLAEMQVPVQHSLGVFLGNVAFLQTIRVPVFGSDFPLWSLANEFWYYCLFPLACLVYFARKSMGKAAALLGFAAIAWLIGWPIFAAFAIWLLGTLVFLASPAERIGRRATAIGIVLAAAGIAAFLIADRAARVPASASDYLLGILFAALLFFVIHGSVMAGRTYARISAFVARSSYTLYLVHFPFFACVLAWRGHRWNPDAAHLRVGAVILLGCYAYALIVAEMFEARTGAVKRWLLPRLGLR